MKTRPWASCPGMGGSTTSFGGASFGTATRGVAPLTSFAVCAAAESAQSAIAIAITAPTRPTFPATFGRFLAVVIQGLLRESLLAGIISLARQSRYWTMVLATRWYRSRPNERTHLRVTSGLYGRHGDDSLSQTHRDGLPCAAR